MGGVQPRPPSVQAGLDAEILRKHVLPNVVAPVLVLTTLDMGVVLLAVSDLSFLGLGVKPPTPEWGAIWPRAATTSTRARR